MANNPFKAASIVAGTAIGLASAVYGAQKFMVKSLSNSQVDFEFLASEQIVIRTKDKAELVAYRDGPRNSELPTIIFLHGYALCSPIWAHQYDLLRENYDLVAFDLRGHGASSLGEQEISLDRFADDLYEVINQLDIDNFILVGHSTGGVVSMAFLDKYNDIAQAKVQGLCLVSTLAHPPYHHLENISEALTKFSLTGKAFHALSEIPLFGYPMARFALGKKAPHSVTEFVRRCIISTDRDVCVKVLQVLADFNYLNVLENFIAPASVIVGTSDPVTPLKDAEKVAKALCVSEIIINDVGHCPMLEDPQEFNIALTEFLDKVKVDS
ncbi:MAG: alpha/beta hydrolase [Acidimicrobiia bacterium]